MKTYRFLLFFILLPAVLYIILLVINRIPANNRRYEATLNRVGWHINMEEQNSDSLLHFNFYYTRKSQSDSLSFLIQNNYCSDVVSFVLREVVICPIVQRYNGNSEVVYQFIKLLFFQRLCRCLCEEVDSCVHERKVSGRHTPQCLCIRLLQYAVQPRRLNTFHHKDTVFRSRQMVCPHLKSVF